jgi:gentisate 1,2-dioxygenase
VDAQRFGERLGRELARLRVLLMEARAQAKDAPIARYHIELAIRRVDHLALTPNRLDDEDGAPVEFRDPAETGEPSSTDGV